MDNPEVGEHEKTDPESSDLQEGGHAQVACESHHEVRPVWLKEPRTSEGPGAWLYTSQQCDCYRGSVSPPAR